MINGSAHNLDFLCVYLSIHDVCVCERVCMCVCTHRHTDRLQYIEAEWVMSQASTYVSTEHMSNPPFTCVQCLCLQNFHDSFRIRVLKTLDCV